MIYDRGADFTEREDLKDMFALKGLVLQQGLGYLVERGAPLGDEGLRPRRPRR